MLNRLFSTIKRGSRKIGQGGYTLIEIAAVVAVTATLAAVVVPIAVDKTKEGKLVAAKQDCQAIGGAIAGFYKDVGYWPAYEGTVGGNLKHFQVLRSGTETGALGAAVHDPVDAATVWDEVTLPLTDLLENHLIKDNPGNIHPAAYLNTAKLNWKGPYAESFTKKDPWGNNYLVFVYGMHTPTSGTAKRYGWIISAGPNAKLETDPFSNLLEGDDIGVMLYAAETGH